MSNEWEKKWNDGVRPCAWDEVADFITAIVSTREKEIADEVNKLEKEMPDRIDEEDVPGVTDQVIGFNNALEQVLKILKH